MQRMQNRATAAALAAATASVVVASAVAAPSASSSNNRNNNNTSPAAVHCEPERKVSVSSSSSEMNVSPRRNRNRSSRPSSATERESERIYNANAVCDDDEFIQPSSSSSFDRQQQQQQQHRHHHHHHHHRTAVTSSSSSSFFTPLDIEEDDVVEDNGHSGPSMHRNSHNHNRNNNHTHYHRQGPQQQFHHHVRTTRRGSDCDDATTQQEFDEINNNQHLFGSCQQNSMCDETDGLCHHRLNNGNHDHTSNTFSNNANNNVNSSGGYNIINNINNCSMESYDDYTSDGHHLFSLIESYDADVNNNIDIDRAVQHGASHHASSTNYHAPQPDLTHPHDNNFHGVVNDNDDEDIVQPHFTSHQWSDEDVVTSSSLISLGLSTGRNRMSQMLRAVHEAYIGGPPSTTTNMSSVMLPSNEDEDDDDEDDVVYGYAARRQQRHRMMDDDSNNNSNTHHGEHPIAAASSSVVHRGTTRHRLLSASTTTTIDDSMSFAPTRIMTPLEQQLTNDDDAGSDGDVTMAPTSDSIIREHTTNAAPQPPAATSVISPQLEDDVIIDNYLQHGDGGSHYPSADIKQNLSDPLVVLEIEEHVIQKIDHSAKFEDDVYEYRSVMLPRNHPYMCLDLEIRGRLLTEVAWRSIGIRQTRGWEHFGYSRHESNVLLFRRAIGTDGKTGKPTPAATEAVRQRTELISQTAISLKAIRHNEISGVHTVPWFGSLERLNDSNVGFSFDPRNLIDENEFSCPHVRNSQVYGHVAARLMSATIKKHGLVPQSKAPFFDLTDEDYQILDGAPVMSDIDCSGGPMKLAADRLDHMYATHHMPLFA